MGTKFRIVTVILCLLVFISFSLVVQGKSPGLIFPGTIESMEINPAKLGISTNRFELQLNPLFLAVGNNAFTIDYLLANVNSFIDEAQKEEILNSMTGDALSLGVDLDVGAYLGVGSVWARSKLQGNLQVDLGKELFELLLKGTGTDPDLKLEFNNTGAKTSFSLDTGLSFAIPLKGIARSLNWESLHLGTGLHYLYGIAFVDASSQLNVETSLEEEEPYINGEGDIQILYSLSPHISNILAQTNPDDEFFSELPLDEGGGQGFAVDVGLWAQPTSKLGFGVALMNLGRMEWSGVRNSQFRGTFEMDHPVTQIDKEENENGDDLFREDFTEIVNEPHDNIISDTPWVLKGGVHYQLFPRLHLAASVGYDQKPVPNTNFSLGTRFYIPRWIPLTVVMDYDTYRQNPSVSAHLGLHLKGLELINISVSDITLAPAGNAKGASVAVSTAIRF